MYSNFIELERELTVQYNFATEAIVVLPREGLPIGKGYPLANKSYQVNYLNRKAVLKEREWVKDFYRQIIESCTQHGCVVTDKQGYILTWNRGAENITGYPENSMLGKSLVSIYSEDSATSFDFLDELKQAEKTGPTSSKVWWHRLDGTRVLVRTTISPLYNPGGELRGYAVTFDDYSGFRQYQARLKEFLRELTDIKYAIDVSNCLSITDMNANIIYVNDSFCNLSGFSRQELIGQNHRIVNSSYHPPEFFEQMYKTITQGKVWRGEIRNRAKNGSIFWVDMAIVPFLDSAGHPYQYVAIQGDITRRKEMEEALRASEKYLNSILNTIGNPVFVLDEHQRLVSINNAICHLSGLSHDALLGKTIAEIGKTTTIPQMDRLIQATNDVLETGQEVILEHTVLDVQGAHRVMETRKTCYQDEQGHRYVVGVMHDITALKSAQQELMKLNQELEQRVLGQTEELRAANASLKEANNDLRRALQELKNNERLREIFVSTLTHDLRTPLAGEKRALEILSTLKSDLPEDMETLIDHMVQANEELLNMVNKLLEIYKLEAGRISLLLEPVDLQKLVSRCIDEVSVLATQKQIQIDNLLEGLPAIHADAFQLKRVFINLLHNAVENIPPGSLIRVEGHPVNGEVELFFTDNGPGIPPTVMAHLFDRYFTHKSGNLKVSSGLGLYICRMIMELHEGTISVQRRKGQGTCFILRLPERPEEN